MIHSKDRKELYRTLLHLAVPMMITNGITNFSNMLDNIMIGSIGTVQMSGVSISNQLFMIFQIAIWGAISGAGIYTAQFYGREQYNGIKYTIRYKVIGALSLVALGSILLFTFKEDLVSLFLTEDNSGLSVADTLGYAMIYIRIMLAGLFPYGISQAISGTMRETDHTVYPMVVSFIGVGSNLVLNYILIFGKFGAPALGVVGAATATVISRFIEMILYIGELIIHKQKYPFLLKDTGTSEPLPEKLFWKITKMSIPLLANESLWSLGIAMLSQSYSTRGISAVAAVNIVSALSSTANVANIALGNAIGIHMSHLLGAGETDKAVKDSINGIRFTTVIVALTALIAIMISPLFPKLYNTTDEIRHTASQLIVVMALHMPLGAIANATYFTLRSGGKSFITFLSDSCFTWVLQVPVAFFVSRLTVLPLLPLYALTNLMDVFKSALGIILVKKGIWLKTL